jgi:hypothetical protein
LPPHWNKLGLTDEQKRKVYTIETEYESKIEALQQQLKTLQEQEQNELAQVLTDEQKTRLKMVLLEARWVVLFQSDDPSVWNTDCRGAKFAIPLRLAPVNTRYLRLRRLDTREALILPITRDQLDNEKLPTREIGYWWNGTAKDEWKGRHLGIAQGPRYKFPTHRGMIHVMTEGWDGFTGSGFGHKCFSNDKQYYCWRGKEIPRTFFQIAVTSEPLTPEEGRCLLARP